jgi:Fe-S cluster assembly scaffold protein SufB
MGRGNSKNKAAEQYLCHDDEESSLSHVATFTTHVRSGDDHCYASAVLEFNVIRHITPPHQGIYHWVPSANDT